MNYELKIKKQKPFLRAYTVLFTILVISVLSTLAAGIANITTKQRILSRLASDSQSAMYLTDAGMECALYHYYLGTLTGNFDCVFPIDPGGSNAKLVTMSEATSGTKIYTFSSSNTPMIPSSSPCFQIETTVDGNGNITKIVSRGYNTCSTSNSRRVERALEVTFKTAF